MDSKRGEKGRIQGNCVGHFGTVFLSMVDDEARTSRHDSNPLSATNYRRVSPVNADSVEFGRLGVQWSIEGPNVVSNSPSRFQAIHTTKCRHPQQARLPLTDTRLYR